jgi:hypothetical protein
MINGLCLDLAAGTVDLAACDTSIATQNWRQLYGGPLEDLGTGTCLSAVNDTNPLTLVPCDSANGYQQWHILGGSVQSGVNGMCMASQPNPDPRQPWSMVIEPCGQPGAVYLYSFGLDGRIYTSTVDSSCPANGDSQWLVLSDGQIANQGLGLCLDDPGNSTVAGTQLVVAPCYGTLGEIWALA